MTLRLKNKLLRREKLGNLRRLQISPRLIDFSSNDYLGLSRSSELTASIRQELCHHSTLINGSTGSRLLSGNTLYAQDLENKIALFHGYETGLLFSCGYMANVGLLSAIAGADDVIIFDAKVHASTRDGIRLSRANAFPFRHNDLEHLETRLKSCTLSGDRFICIESIYSTDGSIALLPEICLLAKKYEAHLIVDEAHAVGACGPNGRGLVAERNLTSQVFAQVTTFGKAIGTYGAIVMGNHTLKQALVNFSTPYIYTTALPLHSLAAIKCSYDLFPLLKSERKHLEELIQVFRNYHTNASLTHIQAISFKGNDTVKFVAAKLVEHGFDVRPLMSPTVRRGNEALRICLHAFNTGDEVAQLLEYIAFYRGT